MRLIDVGVLKEWVENWFTKNRFYHPYAKNNNIPIPELYDIIEQMPSAQPEIIRCKDCRYYKLSNLSSMGMPIRICEYWKQEDVDDDDFCSRSERRTDG